MQSNLRDLRAPAYTRNVTTLKRYGNAFYKVTQSACVRTKGVELENPTPKGTVNESKLQNNICRAKSAVREYGLCNEWDYFITFTINGDYFNRYKLGDFKKVLSQWLRDYRKKHNCTIRYLLIPEQHKDGAWHFHGFIQGLPAEHLTPFTLQEKLPHYLRKQLAKGESIYNWDAYAKKFGYVTLEPIRSKEKAVNYITKYITKDLAYSVKDLGAHLYYASQGLQRAEELKRGTLITPIPVDYSNEHCSITWFSAEDTNLEQLQQLIQKHI